MPGGEGGEGAEAPVEAVGARLGLLAGKELGLCSPGVAQGRLHPNPIGSPSSRRRVGCDIHEALSRHPRRLLWPSMVQMASPTHI